MGRDYPNSVKYTGARAGDVLMGLRPSNQGLKVLVEEDQAIGLGGNLEGKFTLLDAGSGYYAPVLKHLEGCSFGSCEQLVERVLRSNEVSLSPPPKYLLILYRNYLAKER